MDGNRGTNWYSDRTCTDTRAEENPTWAVDLGEMRLISNIDITTRDSNGNLKKKNMHIKVDTDACIVDYVIKCQLQHF